MSQRTINKRANASISDYESDGTIAKLAPILSTLMDGTLDLSQVTPKHLSQLLIQLIQFNEEAFGVDAPKDTRIAMMKLPFSCFNDFEPTNGTIVHILRKCYSFKAQQEWKRFDFTLLNQKRTEKNVELFRSIQSDLEQKGFIQVKSIYINVNDLAHKKQLESSVRDMSMCRQVVDEKDATHVVLDDPEHLKESEGGEDYLRTIESNQTISHIHWWYYPDSYDEWMSKANVQGEGEVEPNLQRDKWKVHARFIRDSHFFNEWMNENDYDLTLEDASEQAQQLGTLPTPADATPQPPQGRNKRRILQTNKRSASDAQLEETSNKRIKTNNETSIAQQQQTTSSAQSTIPTVIVPSHSAWFKLEEVNEVERRSLPEFFDNKSPDKNATIYKQYRNYMVNTFRRDTNRYLTATECRKVLTGDVCAIMRVHTFLEQWGLINYGVDPRNKPIGLNQTFSNQPANPMYHDYTKDPSQHTMMTNTEKMILLNTHVNASQVLSQQGGNRFAVPQPSQPNHMNAGPEWSDDETLKLLDAVDKYKEDWSAVAQMVGNNRTKEQCLMHFVQLPIEDDFLVDAQEVTSSSNEQPMPFADSTNPIMSTIAFLSSMVSPSVASAAAQAALAAFDQ
ncbi:hypothetical protein AKO1_000874, partial [Acrasis kona]